MSQKKRIIGVGIASIIQKFIKVAEQLLLVPFFLKFWGVEYYGEWLTLTIIPSVLGFSDFGFGSAVANTFVLRYAAGNKQSAANIAKAGFRVISYVIIIALVISLTVLYILKVLHVFDKSIIPAHDAILAVMFMITAKLIDFYQQIFDAFYRAVRKASLSRHLGNIYGIIIIVVAIVVLKTGGHIITFALSTLVLSLLFNPLFAWISFKIADIKEFKTATVNKNDIKETFSTGIGFMLAPAWQAIFFQGTTFVVRIVLGPAAVAIYNTVRTLSRSMNQLYSVINGSVFPEFQYEVGAGNMDKARKLFSFSIIVTAIMAVGGMLFLWFFGLPIYQLWTKNSLQPPIIMWLFFVISIGFNALWWTSEVVFLAYNQPMRINLAGLIFSLASIVVTYFACTYFKLTGASVGYFIFDFLMVIYILPLAFNKIGIKYKDLSYTASNFFLMVSNKYLKKGRAADS